jgi:hypothetical protein
LGASWGASWGEIWGASRGAGWGASWRAIREQVWKQDGEQVGKQIGEQVWKQDGEQVREQVGEPLWHDPGKHDKHVYERVMLGPEPFEQNEKYRMPFSTGQKNVFLLEVMTSKQHKKLSLFEILFFASEANSELPDFFGKKFQNGRKYTK